MKPKNPIISEVIQIEDRYVTVEVFRATGLGGKFRGSWKCYSRPYCSGASSERDDDPQVVFAYNRGHAAMTIEARLEELKEDAPNE